MIQTIEVMDIREGMVYREINGTPYRVEKRKMLPPAASIQAMVALTLRDLNDGTYRRIVRPAMERAELLTLEEQTVECLYLTDWGCVLFAPHSSEQYDTPDWVGALLDDGPKIGHKLVAGFWRSSPVTLRPVLAQEQQEG